MTAYIGNSGVVKIGSDTIAEITGFTVTETVGTAEDTALGDTARTYKSDALPTWTASVEGHYFPGDTNGQALIVGGATLSWVFNFLGTGAGTKKYSGSGIVTQRQLGQLQNGEIIPFSAQVQGSGPLTEGTN